MWISKATKVKTVLSAYFFVTRVSNSTYCQRVYCHCYSECIIHVHVCCDIIMFFDLQILDALCFIHQPRERIRFVHRDLKPSNIFFARGREESLKIGDFGLVKGNALIEPTGNLKISYTCTAPEKFWGSQCIAACSYHNSTLRSLL